MAGMKKKYYDELIGDKQKNIMGNPKLGGVDNFDTIKTYYKELKKEILIQNICILNKVILWIEKYL